jgi:hypothetical protein
MSRFFSPSTGGFYSEAVNGPRRIEGELSARERKAGKRAPMIDNPRCTLPADAVEIGEERYGQLMQAQAEGKAITVLGGRPVAVERVPDAAERDQSRRRERDRRLAASDWTQLPDSPLDAAARTAWALYRQALRDLDMSGTDWPSEPAETAAS